MFILITIFYSDLIFSHSHSEQLHRWTIFRTIVILFNVRENRQFHCRNVLTLHNSTNLSHQHERSSWKWNERRNQVVIDHIIRHHIDILLNWTNRQASTTFEDIAEAQADIGVMHEILIDFLEVSDMQHEWIGDVLQYFTSNVHHIFPITFLQLQLNVSEVFVEAQVLVVEVDFVAALLTWLESEFDEIL